MAAALNAAAVNPDDDRMVHALCRGVDIERLSFVLRVAVGEITLDFRLVGRKGGGEENDEEDGDGAHGFLQNGSVVPFNVIFQKRRPDKKGRCRAPS